MPLGAQTVRPAVVEYPVHGRGSFDLVNETLFPMTVVLEPRGFHVDENGELADAPFDTANVELKLSAMSFRIPPLATYTVHYEAKARKMPAWFMVLSSMSGGRTSNGINVRIELPHVVYLLQKQPLKKEAVVVRGFSFDSAKGRAVLDLENTSASFRFSSPDPDATSWFWLALSRRSEVRTTRMPYRGKPAIFMGAAALMLSINPALSVVSVRDILARTAAKIGGQQAWTPEFGWGRLDVSKAVETARLAGTPNAPLVAKVAKTANGPARKSARKHAGKKR